MSRTPLRLATDPGSTLCTTKQAYMCLFEVGSRPISPTPRRLSPSCAARGGIRATCGLQARRGGEGKGRRREGEKGRRREGEAGVRGGQITLEGGIRATCGLQRGVTGTGHRIGGHRSAPTTHGRETERGHPPARSRESRTTAWEWVGFVHRVGNAWEMRGKGMCIMWTCALPPQDPDLDLGPRRVEQQVDVRQPELRHLRPRSRTPSHGTPLSTQLSASTGQQAPISTQSAPIST